MRFGLSFLPDVSPDNMSGQEYYAGIVELALMAESAGLYCIKMTEHYLRPYGGFCSSPLTFLAAIATRTRRVRLMTGGILASFHHPIHIASETAMVDAISAGRLDAGFARAYMPYEFDAFAVPLDDGRTRFTASVDAVVRLWTEIDVTIETPFFAFEHCTVLPRPTQLPHPPVWIAASLSPDSFAWIGRRGFHLLATNVLSDPEYLKELIVLYRRSFSDARGTDDGRVALSVPLYVSASQHRAIEEGDCYLARHLATWAAAAETWRGIASPAYPAYAHMADVIRASTPERVRGYGGVVFGCPEAVKDAIARLREEFGVDEILWQVDFGAMPPEASRRNVRTFVDQVLPAV